MMRIRFYRNDAEGAPRWASERLPVRQRLYWVGPLFVLVQRSRKTEAT